MVVQGGFINSWVKKRSESQGRKEKISQLNTEFQWKARRDKKAFLNEQYKEREDGED